MNNTSGVPELGDYRWTLSEYVLRCETGDDLREIVVEGQLDRDVLQDALARWRAAGVDVLDAAYLHVTDVEVEAAGFSRGVKGVLQTVAAHLAHRAEDAHVGAHVLVVVDRDYDAPAEHRFLAVTDGYSVESYACTASALERFIRLLLGRAPRTRRAGGAPAPLTCTGADMVAKVYNAAIGIAAVRLTLRDLDPAPRVFDRWADYVRIDTDGSATIEDERLVENVMRGSGNEAPPVLGEMLAAAREAAARDPFRLVRGHDFLAVLQKVLRSPWGRKLAGTRFRTTSEDELARTIIAMMDSIELDKYPLFERLRAAFA